MISQFTQFLHSEMNGPNFTYLVQQADQPSYQPTQVTDSAAEFRYVIFSRILSLKGWSYKLRDWECRSCKLASICRSMEV
jgi:hypothetical protein